MKRATITVEQATCHVRGYNVRDVLREAGLKPLNAGKRGWVLDRHRLPDAVGALEWAGYQLRISEDGERV